MLDFLTLKPESFGLDISDLSLKIAKLQKKNSGIKLSSWGEARIDPGIVENGEIRNQRELTRSIKKAVKNIKGKDIRTKHVAVSLPEEKSFLQVVQMPKMSREELSEAVRFEAENYIPMSKEEVYLDFQIVKPLQNHLDHLDVLINALPKKVIDPYVSVVKKAGLQPVALEMESQAIARALIKKDDPPSPVAILDLGRSRTSFIIFSGRSLRFTASIPLCSQDIDKAISQKMKVGFKEAEDIKKKYNLTKRDKTKKNKKVFRAIEPILENLVKEVQKYLDFYRTHDSHNHFPEGKSTKIQRILLCGGGANFKGFPQYLSGEIDLPVKWGNPWVNIYSESPGKVLGVTPQKALSLTSAIGLALK